MPLNTKDPIESEAYLKECEKAELEAKMELAKAKAKHSHCVKERKRAWVRNEINHGRMEEWTDEEKRRNMMQTYKPNQKYY